MELIKPAPGNEKDQSKFKDKIPERKVGNVAENKKRKPVESIEDMLNEAGKSKERKPFGVAEKNLWSLLGSGK